MNEGYDRKKPKKAKKIYHKDLILSSTVVGSISPLSEITIHGKFMQWYTQANF